MAQVSQSVACNGLHRLEQRCCRWLLMSRDRVGSDDLRLTHEYLARCWGAGASVTEALRRSRRRAWSAPTGAGSHPRRGGLEARSCECYFVVKKEFDGLLGTTV